jgi:branched-chain amino acid transport system substrate-binding protein
MKRLSVVFLALLLLISQTLVSVAAQTPEAADAAKKIACPADKAKITFGAAVSLTGSLAREGEDTKQGYDIWAEWVNTEYGGVKVGNERHCVEIKYYDDESKAETVSVLTEKLITEDKVQFILGPYSSGLTNSASVITERYKVIMVEGNGAAESLFNRGFKYLFGVLTPGSFYTKAALETAAKLGAKTVVIAHQDEPFATSVAKGAEQWAKELKLEILAFEKYPGQTPDLTALFTKFRELNPDLLVGGGHFNNAAVFVKTAKALNWSPKAIIMTVGPSNPAFAKEMGADAEYVWGATQWESAMTWKDEYFGTAEQYAARFKAKYPDDPGVNYQNAESTAAGLVLQLAIERAGSLETDKVRDELAKTDIVTFYGPVKFDETGKNIGKPMGAIQIQKGKIIPIAPAEVAAGQPIYPAPAWDKR